MDWWEEDSKKLRRQLFMGKYVAFVPPTPQIYISPETWDKLNEREIMDERQWLSGDKPDEMLYQLLGREPYGDQTAWGRMPIATDRKLRLFVCAAVRLVWYEVDSKRRCEIENTEALVDSSAMKPWTKKSIVWYASPIEEARYIIEWFQHREPSMGEKQIPKLANLLRLIFGNPFRPVELPVCWIDDSEKPKWVKKSCPWLTPQVLSMAQELYDTRDAAGFGEFWDALETAGCDSEEIRRALAWEQRCPSCPDNPGKGYVLTHSLNKEWEYSPCVPCNGTGWLPMPGEPFMVRGMDCIDRILGLA